MELHIRYNSLFWYLSPVYSKDSKLLIDCGFIKKMNLKFEIYNLI